MSGAGFKNLSLMFRVYGLNTFTTLTAALLLFKAPAVDIHDAPAMPVYAAILSARQRRRSLSVIATSFRYLVSRRRMPKMLRGMLDRASPFNFALQA